jgi:hypothetical protein
VQSVRYPRNPSEAVKSTLSTILVIRTSQFPTAERLTLDRSATAFPELEEVGEYQVGEMDTSRKRSMSSNFVVPSVYKRLH